jgi:hypothetical protein
MAKTINILVDYNLNDLQTISITDATDFSLPDAISDINGVRMLFSTVNSVNQTALATTCLAWYQYEVLSGTAIANGISYPTGSTMIFASDTTPTGTFTMQTTGVYSQYISNQLPSNGLPYTFTPTQVGREAYNTSYFQDEVFSLVYEQYETTYIAGSTLAAGTYLVKGTIGNAATIGSKVIYVGETYTSAGSETFSGSVVLVKFEDSAQFTFATQYQSFKTYEMYLAEMGASSLPNEPLQAMLLQVAALFASPSIAAITDQGISLTQLQSNLDQINNYYSLHV